MRIDLNIRAQVSIIIPIYNSELYLRDCLDSILAQTYTDLDIICINDGSRDGSLQLLNDIAASDHRIRVISQPNRGVSSARNAGLEIARGEFVMFVDSDDVVAPGMVEAFHAAMTGQVDFVISSPRAEKLTRCGDKDALLYECIRDYSINPPWAKMYRMCVVRAGDLLFDTSISIGEDLLFNLRYAQVAQGEVAVIDAGLYGARETSGSLTRSFRPDKLRELLVVDREMRSILGEDDPRMVSLLNFLKMKAVISAFNNRYRNAPPMSRKARQEFIKFFSGNLDALPVRHGDIVMKAVSLAYRYLGLGGTSRIVRVAQHLRATRVKSGSIPPLVS